MGLDAAGGMSASSATPCRGRDLPSGRRRPNSCRPPQKEGVVEDEVALPGRMCRLVGEVAVIQGDLLVVGGVQLEGLRAGAPGRALDAPDDDAGGRLGRGDGPFRSTGTSLVTAMVRWGMS